MKRKTDPLFLSQGDLFYPPRQRKRREIFVNNKKKWKRNCGKRIRDHKHLWNRYLHSAKKPNGAELGTRRFNNDLTTVFTPQRRTPKTVLCVLWRIDVTTFWPIKIVKFHRRFARVTDEDTSYVMCRVIWKPLLPHVTPKVQIPGYATAYAPPTENNPGSAPVMTLVFDLFYCFFVYS